MTLNIKYIKSIFPIIFYKILKYFYHIFRYYNLTKPNYSTSQKIIFGSKIAGNFLKNKILKSNFFFEYGSGNTTIFSKYNKKNFFSVESDRSFFLFLIKKKIKNIFFYSLGFVEFFSYPLFKSFFFRNFYSKKAIKYSSAIFDLCKDKKNIPDLILVDGRYRVLCMLNIYLYLKKNSLNKACVVIDDFKKRKYYHIVKQLFKTKTIGRLGVCYLKQKKQNLNFQSLIKKYSNDPR